MRLTQDIICYQTNIIYIKNIFINKNNKKDIEIIMNVHIGSLRINMNKVVKFESSILSIEGMIKEEN